MEKKVSWILKILILDGEVVAVNYSLVSHNLMDTRTSNATNDYCSTSKYQKKYFDMWKSKLSWRDEVGIATYPYGPYLGANFSKRSVQICIYFAIILMLRKAIIWLDYWYIWEGNIRYVSVKHEIYRYFFCSKIFICSIFSRFLIQIHIAVNEVKMKLIKGEVLKIFSFT